MDKQRRGRYLVAIYLFVTTGAIAMLLAGLYYTTDPLWQSVWINLATGMLGVTLLFFLVDRFFLADEWGLSDRIDQLISRLELAERPSAQEFFISHPDFEHDLRFAKSIRFAGVTLTGTINRHFGLLRERLAQEATVQILVADPNSLALKMSALRSERPDEVEYYSKRLESTFKDLGFLYEYSQEHTGALAAAANPLAIRMLAYAPSFGIWQFEKQDGSKIAYVEVYPHGPGYQSPPIFALTPERDRSWYDYFAEQFAYMWKRAVPWEPGMGASAKQDQRPRTAPASEFLVRRQDVPLLLLEDARQIWIAGVTLASTPRPFLRQQDHCLAAGGEVKLMILEADQQLLEECVKRSHGKTTPDFWRIRLDSTAAYAEMLAHTPGMTGTVQLGRLPYLPSFGFFIIDPHTDHGVIIVELYHHRSNESNPTFTLYANRDGEWYKFFLQQFTTMWDSCRVEEFGQTVA